ncbi:uncharacterized protein [Palaemon carinicauda]|uniref:uncharacterized protein n=1 Tax=Palaemon carinicauda TaxID=392227 RepID=UPI0035B63BA1
MSALSLCMTQGCPTTSDAIAKTALSSLFHVSQTSSSLKPDLADGQFKSPQDGASYTSIFALDTQLRHQPLSVSLSRILHHEPQPTKAVPTETEAVPKELTSTSLKPSTSSPTRGPHLAQKKKAEHPPGPASPLASPGPSTCAPGTTTAAATPPAEADISAMDLDPPTCSTIQPVTTHHPGCNCTTCQTQLLPEASTINGTQVSLEAPQPTSTEQHKSSCLPPERTRHMQQQQPSQPLTLDDSRSRPDPT